VTVPQVPGVKVRSRRSDSVWEVQADRLHDLQGLAVASVGAARLTEVDVTVARWRAPSAGWLGSAHVPGIASQSVEPRGRGVRVRLSAVDEADPAVLLAGVVRLLLPWRTDPGPELTFAPGLPREAAPLAPRLRDVLLEGEQRDAHVRRSDLLVVPEPGSAPDAERATTLVVSPDGWVRDGEAFDVCVDPTVHRPVGRRSEGHTDVAQASIRDRDVHLSGPGIRMSIQGRVTAPQVTALRSVGAVVGELPDVVARQLNACGILTAASTDLLPSADDALAWLAASVHGRRHALRRYGPAPAVDGWPSVSAVMVTHRPDHVESAVRQLSALRYPDLQVVLGIHGRRVDPAWAWDLLQDLPFPSTMVTIPGEATLGEALQACSDRAEGALVTKMDDDDVYGPEHIWDLVLARQYSGAHVVGKALDWIHLQTGQVTVFRPTYAAEKYARFVAGGTILISRADLAEVGGWRPVPKSVDRALLDRVLDDGGLVYRTHGLGYVYVRHGHGHTASVEDDHFLTKASATVPGLVQHPEFGTGGGP